MAGQSPTRRSSLVPARVLEHVRLMTRGAYVIGGTGGVAGIVGAYQLVQGAHGVSPWKWFALAAVLLFLSQIYAVQTALKQRDRARRNLLSQTVTGVAVGEGSHRGIRIQDTRVSVGDSSPLTVSRPRKRWWPRLLTPEEQDDLAARCEACSKECLEFLHRPQPRETLRAMTEAEREREDRAQDEHRAETGRRFHAEFSPRIRDLLNECAEAGYSLDAQLERYRLEGQAHWHEMHMAAEGLGVAGRRVRRGAKRL